MLVDFSISLPSTLLASCFSPTFFSSLTPYASATNAPKSAVLPITRLLMKEHVNRHRHGCVCEGRRDSCSIERCELGCFDAYGMGAMVDPAWFYIHVDCQTIAYGVGVAGWGTGLKLGSDSEGIKYTTHRNIGITLFIWTPVPCDISSSFLTECNHAAMSNPENVPDAAAGDDIDDELEEFSEEFKCCVCLDLIYKPVVLACGHISCFWCVFKAMDNWQESRCPVCRHSYYHFPNICWLLHSVLLNSYPKAYQKRESQVTKEEKDNGTSSPQFENYLAASRGSEQMASQSHTMVQGKDRLDRESLEPVPSENNSTPTTTGIPTNSSDQIARNVDVEGTCSVGSDHVDGCYKRISVNDLLCSICKELLCRLVVLNCGHGANCSSVPMDEHVCSSGHKIHYGVGCDCCGMYPLIGNRYKCKDCIEEIGFDLCESCYNSSSNLPGRFNQQHKPDHKFEVLEPNALIILSADYPEDDAPDYPENRADVSTAPDLSLDTHQDPEETDGLSIGWRLHIVHRHGNGLVIMLCGGGSKSYKPE
ncbi:hypothetical protein L1987_00675 [Smallanthus sonchifolius]|uniref:Uncharacterized protein n=1 Tax=Smallanthus sonchifolius TaxID=185202 RepID=A0ACB9K2Y0_9ASTR|nr:hypothetical protein L1987_00675 [Smallanthus sonchifolius]